MYSLHVFAIFFTKIATPCLSCMSIVNLLCQPNWIHKMSQPPGNSSATSAPTGRTYSRMTQSRQARLSTLSSVQLKQPRSGSTLLCCNIMYPIASLFFLWYSPVSRLSGLIERIQQTIHWQDDVGLLAQTKVTVGAEAWKNKSEVKTQHSSSWGVNRSERDQGEQHPQTPRCQVLQWDS